MTDQIAWDTFGPLIIPLQIFHFHKEGFFNLAVHFSSSYYSSAHSSIVQGAICFYPLAEKKKGKEGKGGKYFHASPGGCCIGKSSLFESSSGG